MSRCSTVLSDLTMSHVHADACFRFRVLTDCSSFFDGIGMCETDRGQATLYGLVVAVIGY